MAGLVSHPDFGREGFVKAVKPEGGRGKFDLSVAGLYMPWANGVSTSPRIIMKRSGEALSSTRQGMDLGQALTRVVVFFFPESFRKETANARIKTIEKARE